MERPGSAGVLQRGAEGSLGRALARFVGTRKAHRDGRRKREIKEWPRNPTWYDGPSWTQIKKNGKSLKVHEGDPQHLLKSSKEKNFDVMIFMKYTYCLGIKIAVYLPRHAAIEDYHVRLFLPKHRDTFRRQGEGQCIKMVDAKNDEFVEVVEVKRKCFSPYISLRRSQRRRCEIV